MTCKKSVGSVTWEWTMPSTKSDSSLEGFGKDTLQPSTLEKGQEAPELGQPWPLAAQELTSSNMILIYLMPFHYLVN